MPFNVISNTTVHLQALNNNKKKLFRGLTCFVYLKRPSYQSCLSVTIFDEVATF